MSDYLDNAFFEGMRSQGLMRGFDDDDSLSQKKELTALILENLIDRERGNSVIPDTMGRRRYRIYSV